MCSDCTLATWYQSDKTDDRTCTICGLTGNGQVIRDADEDDFIVHEDCDTSEE